MFADINSVTGIVCSLAYLVYAAAVVQETHENFKDMSHTLRQGYFLHSITIPLEFKIVHVTLILHLYQKYSPTKVIL